MIDVQASEGLLYRLSLMVPHAYMLHYVESVGRIVIYVEVIAHTHIHMPAQKSFMVSLLRSISGVFWPVHCKFAIYFQPFFRETNYWKSEFTLLSRTGWGIMHWYFFLFYLRPTNKSIKDFQLWHGQHGEWRYIATTYWKKRADCMYISFAFRR